MVLPAYAGMIPFKTLISNTGKCAPRVCGDDPVSGTREVGLGTCSPRMRG